MSSPRRAALMFFLYAPLIALQPAQAAGFISEPEAVDPSRDIALQAVSMEAAADGSDGGEDQGDLSALSFAQQLARYAVRMVELAPDIRQQIGVKSDFSTHKS